MGRVTLGIILPLIALPILLFVVWRWYQHTVRPTETESPRTIAGIRLTSEALHRLPSPPWRVIHEIGDQLPGVDHVVIAPAGIAAVRTTMIDRPTPEHLAESAVVGQLVADSAIARGAVDDLLTAVGARCDTLALVFWGRPDARRHAAETSFHATVHVEGQRLTDWLEDWNAHAAPVLDAASVDGAWQAVTTGLGRPDPLR